jgi:hypothetical protein
LKLRVMRRARYRRSTIRSIMLEGLNSGRGESVQDFIFDCPTPKIQQIRWVWDRHCHRVRVPLASWINFISIRIIRWAAMPGISSFVIDFHGCANRIVCAGEMRLPECVADYRHLRTVVLLFSSPVSAEYCRDTEHGKEF